MSEVVLMISELAALAGRHRFQPREEAVVNHMLRYEKEWCQRVRKRYLAEQELHRPNCEKMVELISHLTQATVTLREDIPYSEQLTTLSTEYPQAREELDLLPAREVDIEALAAQKTSQVEQRTALTHEVLTAVAQQINAYGDDTKVKEHIAASVVQHGGTELLATHVLYGCLAEDKGLQYLAEFLQPRGWVEDVALRQKSSYKNTVVNGTSIRIYGRVDAIYRQGEKVLVAENKNRKNRLFSNNPEYDIDQLALYVFTWDATHGLLHQYYEGKTSSTFYSREHLAARVEELLASGSLVESLREILAYREQECPRQFVERYLLEQRA